MKKQIFVVAALAIGSFSYSQDSTSATLDQVVVTASKSPRKQSETGKVITVIGKEEIDRYSGRSLGALLNDQAGLVIGGALNVAGTNQTPYLRGGSSGRTLILIDGIPVYDPSLLYNEFNLNLVSLLNIQRIEICRGAQSTLYGSDAEAGVINIITRRSEKQKAFGGTAQLRAGSYGLAEGQAEWHGNAGRLNYSLQYSGLHNDGFSSAYDSSGKQGFDADGYRAQTARAALGYRLSPALSVSAYMQWSHTQNDADLSAFTDEKDYTLSNRGLMAGTRLFWQKGNVQLTGQYQYSHIGRRYINDSTDTPSFTRYSSDVYYGQAQFAELYANIDLGHGFSLLQGGDYRYSNMNNQFYSLSSFGPYSSRFNDTSQSQASLYTSLYYQSPSGHMNLEAGGRLNVQSRYGSNSTFTFNPSLVLSNSWRIFGSVASAFKVPSLYQLYGAYGLSSLKPEKSMSYELGVARSGTRLSSRLTAFARKLRSGIDFDYINYQYFNFTQQSVWGLEWEARYKPGKKIDLSLNYSYLRPRETSQSRVDFQDTVYHYLLRRPAHLANASLGFRPSGQWYFRIDGKYVSRRYDVGGYQQADVLLSGYFIASAYAEYAFTKHCLLFADAQNLGNRRFFDLYGYRSIPFMLSGGLRVTW